MWLITFTTSGLCVYYLQKALAFIVKPKEGSALTAVLLTTLEERGLTTTLARLTVYINMK